MPTKQNYNDRLSTAAESAIHPQQRILFLWSFMPHHWLPQINTAPQILSNKTLKEICENVRMQGKQFKASFTQDFKSFSTNVDGLNCSRSTNQLLVAYVNSECYTCCCKPIILVVLSTFLTNSIQHSLYIVSAPV